MKPRARSLRLTAVQCRTLSHLLAAYQEDLKLAIKAELLESEPGPLSNSTRTFVANMRAHWRAAEDFQILFSNPCGSETSRKLCDPGETT